MDLLLPVVVTKDLPFSTFESFTCSCNLSLDLPGYGKMKRWCILSSGSVFFLKRFEKRASAEPLSVLKVSSSQQKIFPKAQQIKSLPSSELRTISNPSEGWANRKNPFYSAWNQFKLGFSAFGNPTCRVTKLHFMSSRCLILPVSITPDDKNKHR
ncbi:hypothetical protein AVEN_81448-1 [Araneus ventricosus]|uniref:Uncharacterized protein n=1 Tax=Araneus ventricosus TaxID=182803 RepID=A0A4Y2T8C0_ARAVE|nr:hypothetical protein AVEN_81448-1 [Araneus ventricosus]